MNELNLNKTIFKTALITLCSVLFALILLIGSLTCFYPVSLARFTSSIGLDKLSVYYYELTYKKTLNINDLYNLLNKTILLEDNEKIILNFEVLYDNGSSNYYDFINYINDFYLKSTDNVTLQLHLVNEDARLKSRYVKALFETQKTNKAFEFSIEDLLNESFTSINDFQNLNFIMSSYINALAENNLTNENYAVFENYNNGQDLVNFNYITNALNYYDNVKSIYETTLFLNENNINSFKLFVTANHLIKVAENLIFLDTKLNSVIDSSSLETDIQDYLTELQTLNAYLTSQ